MANLKGHNYYESTLPSMHQKLIAVISSYKKEWKPVKRKKDGNLSNILSLVISKDARALTMCEFLEVTARAK